MDKIRNDWTYRRGKASLRRLREELVDARASPQRVLDPDEQERLDQMQAQVVALALAIASYESLRGAGGMFVEMKDLRDLGPTLVKARVAKGWSQERLAQAMDMPKQQIQRYEAAEYASASLHRVIELADVLGIGFSEATVTGSNRARASSIDSGALTRQRAGYSAVEAVQDLERRIRLRSMTAEEARKVFDDLWDTYNRLSPHSEGASREGSRGIDHRLVVRKAMAVLAGSQGDAS